MPTRLNIGTMVLYKDRKTGKMWPAVITTVQRTTVVDLRVFDLGLSVIGFVEEGIDPGQWRHLGGS